MDHDTSANAIADRVNCYELGEWLDFLFESARVALHLPLGKGRERIDFALVTLGIAVTLFRRADEGRSDNDQLVLHCVAFDALRAKLPFGLVSTTLTPVLAEHLLSDDTAGGRTADLDRGDTRITYFLPEDARVVELTFNPNMVGISSCRVARLGGEFPYHQVERFFGRSRLGC